MTSPLKVGVIGASGNVGQTLVAALKGEPDLELVAAVDHDDSLDTLVASGADIAIDFTSPSAVMDNVKFLIAAHGQDFIAHVAKDHSGMNPPGGYREQTG